ncbi:allantoate deiminase isoform X2 [Tripterygium wilfordii]|uniref:allantoate deiminase n=1 Tax=Tripterygium wilfordii TaxID=458696 RepID=A0A7J7C527_TRIWF|nr:allantoate deiminase 2-like [Tripterygium wilfordii]KAF5729231.1 allantoate deiminase isoform X2 [Tripterygium wilfordii]
MAITDPIPRFSLNQNFSSWRLFYCLSLYLIISSAVVYAEDAEGISSDLYEEVLKSEAVARLYELGKVSDADDYLERTFLSPASVRAGNLIREWMEDAGLRTWVDYMGNVHGRVEGMNKTAEALLIGSHLDTVVDAGIYDGSLGIISAISALKFLKRDGQLGKLQRPVEVIAFSDEEGVRFQSTFLGSAAIAGSLPVSALNISDKRGLTLQDVLKENDIKITEEKLVELKYEPLSVWGYIEVHIEQGPVLEWAGYPLGVVKGIAGQSRLKVIVKGSQGHAGTVPMSLRQDPMAAAAELILLLESLCKHPEEFLSYDHHCNDIVVESLSKSLVCTVGEISTWPSASNVIPGQVTFTVDIRAMEDIGREAIIYELSNQMYQICEKRSVSCIIERMHDANAVNCDSELMLRLKDSANAALERLTGETQDEVPILMSGAGHDAMAISHLTKVGMLFVRCRGGVSHSPAEHVLDDDIFAAGLAIVEFLESQM